MPAEISLAWPRAAAKPPPEHSNAETEERMYTYDDLAIETRIPGDNGDLAREHWNPRQETMPLDQMRALQTRKLKAQLAYLGERSTLYREKYKAAGFDPHSVQSIEDLVHLPFTTKLELRDSQEAAPPFGNHQAAAMDEIRREIPLLGYRFSEMG